MKQITRFAILGIFFVSTLTNADVPLTLCKGKELTVWSCQTKNKTFSLCASPDLSDLTGYMQYRAAKSEVVELAFPKSLLHPKGRFEFNLLAHGASVSFSNGGYSYSIYEDMKGGASISVAGQGIKSTKISCSNSTDTLTLNSTIDLFKKVGVSD